MNNEQRFLNRVRQALGRSEYDGTAPLIPSRPEGELDALLKQADREREGRLELLALLKKTAAPLNLSVHEAKSLDAAGETIATIARNADTEWGGDKRIVMHEDKVVEGLCLEDKLAGDAIPVKKARLEDGEDELSGKQRLRELVESAYIGVTGADWGVADCAAIALMAGPGHGRAVSLVPSLHIAVLKLDRLVRDLPELYAQLESATALPSAFNFISGPSKTADIEAELVHGAHGPREMHLVVVTE